MTEYLLAALCVEVGLLIWLGRGAFVRFDRLLQAQVHFARSHSGDLTAINNATTKTWHVIEELKSRVKGS